MVCWRCIGALSPTEGVLFGGLTGSDAAPVRLDDAWLPCDYRLFLTASNSTYVREPEEVPVAGSTLTREGAARLIRKRSRDGDDARTGAFASRSSASSSCALANLVCSSRSRGDIRGGIGRATSPHTSCGGNGGVMLRARSTAPRC